MEVFECVICITNSSTPVMCGGCHKFMCTTCIEGAYAAASGPAARSCPHCRTQQPLASYVRLNWLNEVRSKLSMVNADHCPRAGCSNRLLNLYCSTCDVSCCSDCGVNVHKHSVNEPSLAPVEWRRRSIGGDLEAKINTMANDIAKYGTELLRDAQTYQHHLAEGERILEMTINELKENFFLQMQGVRERLASRFTKAKEAFSKGNIVAAKYAEAAESPFLNRLVDINQETIKEVEDVQKCMDKARRTYMPLQMDHLAGLSAHLPKWELHRSLVIMRSASEVVIQGSLRTWQIRREETEPASDKFKLNVALMKNDDGCKFRFESYEFYIENRLSNESSDESLSSDWSLPPLTNLPSKPTKPWPKTVKTEVKRSMIEGQSVTFELEKEAWGWQGSMVLLVTIRPINVSSERWNIQAKKDHEMKRACARIRNEYQNETTGKTAAKKEKNKKSGGKRSLKNHQSEEKSDKRKKVETNREKEGGEERHDSTEARAADPEAPSTSSVG